MKFPVSKLYFVSVRANREVIYLARKGRDIESRLYITLHF